MSSEGATSSSFEKRRIGQVLITCPVTSEAIYTGVDMDSQEFEHTAFNMTVKCVRCGDQHDLNKTGAWLRHRPVNPSSSPV